MPSKEDPAAPQPDEGGSFSPVYDAEEFRLAAIHIFGRIGWKKNTALAFGVTESTVYRWVSESVPIPHHAASAMGAWLIVLNLTGQTPPLATDDERQPKPKRRNQDKVRLRL